MNKTIIVGIALVQTMAFHACGENVITQDEKNTPYARAIRALDAKDWERFAYWAEMVDYSQWDVRIKSGLGHCYRKELGGKKRDGKRAFDILSDAVRYADTAKTAAASNEVSRAFLDLGICYHAGLGVATNHVEAVKWYRRSAERGYADAQFCLGVCYHHGIGIGQDVDTALSWYRKAVAGGHKGAQQSIDKILKQRDGTLKQREKNLSIREKHLSAMVLASGIDGGNHSKKDEYELFRDIASHENDKGLGEEERECVGNALFCVGAYYREGIPGVIQKDVAKAFDYFRRAANFNNPVAQHNVGVCYERGDGVVQSFTEALKWYRKAAENGYEKSRKAIKTLEARMRAGQKS